MPEQPTFVDLAFPLVGESLPLDHGYALFGALSGLIPALRDKADWGVHPIRGLRAQPGVLRLLSHGGARSTVKIRVPAAAIAEVLGLAGARLELNGHRISLGAPTVHPLVPCDTLRARLVTIRGFFDDPGPFDQALRRQLATIPGLGQDPERIIARVLDRRVMRVRGRIVVGFQVQLEELEPAASIAVQIRGLGGRRHMGAGVFVPPPRQRGQR